MTVGAVVVTVHCDGAFHEPEQLRFHERVLKSDINDKLRSLGWLLKVDGTTYCPSHKNPSDRTTNR